MINKLHPQKFERVEIVYNGKKYAGYYEGKKNWVLIPMNNKEEIIVSSSEIEYWKYSNAN